MHDIIDLPQDQLQKEEDQKDFKKSSAGSDLIHIIKIDLEDAYKGINVKFKINPAEGGMSNDNEWSEGRAEQGLSDDDAMRLEFRLRLGTRKVLLDNDTLYTAIISFL